MHLNFRENTAEALVISIRLTKMTEQDTNFVAPLTKHF